MSETREATQEDRPSPSGPEIGKLLEELEAAPGVEPGNRGFADLRLNHLATPPAANSDSSERQPFDQGELLDESAGPVYGGESLP